LKSATILILTVGGNSPQPENSAMKLKFLTCLILCGHATLTARSQTLLDAVPNPFSTSTELRIYDLEEDTVSLKVFTMTGQDVKTFFTDLVLSGTFAVTFNADTLPNGAYFVQLIKNGETNGFKIVKIQDATSIENIEYSKSKIKLFPNPTADILTISTNLVFNEISVYGLDGRQILTSNAQTKSLDISRFKHGTYILQLVTDDRTYLEKIVKN